MVKSEFQQEGYPQNAGKPKDTDRASEILGKKIERREMILRKHFKRMQSTVFGGAVAVKSVDVLGHAKNPTALAGDIEGLASIGVASGIGSAVMGMALGGKPRKVKHKR